MGVEITEQEERVRVAIHIDVPGIPEELRDKVMTPFLGLSPKEIKRLAK